MVTSVTWQQLAKEVEEAKKLCLEYLEDWIGSSSQLPILPCLVERLLSGVKEEVKEIRWQVLLEIAHHLKDYDNHYQEASKTEDWEKHHKWYLDTYSKIGMGSNIYKVVKYIWGLP